jgi:hypothetical protein
MAAVVMMIFLIMTVILHIGVLRDFEGELVNSKGHSLRMEGSWKEFCRGRAVCSRLAARKWG